MDGWKAEAGIQQATDWADCVLGLWTELLGPIHALSLPPVAAATIGHINSVSWKGLGSCPAWRAGWPCLHGPLPVILGQRRKGQYYFLEMAVTEYTNGRGEALTQQIYSPTVWGAEVQNQGISETLIPLRALRRVLSSLLSPFKGRC